MSKSELTEHGFNNNHFRSKSKKQDVERGFESYAHLTTSSFPPILEAKLTAGFPHIALKIPSSLLDDVDFDLCRYNVAMTRKLRRGNQFGHNIGPANGQYYGDIQIPIARSVDEQNILLGENFSKGNMIEVLVDRFLDLDESVEMIAFDNEDATIINKILQELDLKQSYTISECDFYDRNQVYVSSCEQFINHSLNNPQWPGDGLEFDKV